MASLAWDRFLETMLRRKADLALFFAGSAPLIPMNGSFRALQIAAMTSADLAAFADAQTHGQSEDHHDGYRYTDFWYGDALHLRLMIFDYPDPHRLVVTVLARLDLPPEPGA
jgi:hypothetical protein